MDRRTIIWSGLMTLALLFTMPGAADAQCGTRTYVQRSTYYQGYGGGYYGGYWRPTTYYHRAPANVNYAPRRTYYAPIYNYYPQGGTFYRYGNPQPIYGGHYGRSWVSVGVGF